MAQDYARALERLSARGLVYPCFCSRGQIAAAAGARAIPTARRSIPASAARFRRARSPRASPPASARRCASMRRARSPRRRPIFAGAEYGEGAREALHRADPAAWGDFVLRGKDNAASYHLAVVVDDALQGVSDVVRGRDLLAATSAHRLLQALLDLAAAALSPPPAGARRQGRQDVEEPPRRRRCARCARRDIRRCEVRAALGFEALERAAARRALQLTFAATAAGAGAGAAFGACAIS